MSECKRMGTFRSYLQCTFGKLMWHFSAFPIDSSKLFTLIYFKNFCFKTVEQNSDISAEWNCIDSTLIMVHLFFSILPWSQYDSVGNKNILSLQNPIKDDELWIRCTVRRFAFNPNMQSKAILSIWLLQGKVTCWTISFTVFKST